MTQETAGPDSICSVDLSALLHRANRSGLIWSGGSADLNINLLSLSGDREIPAHINNQVDVMIVCVEGAGVVTIDETPHTLTTGQIIIVPKSSARSIAATSASFSYLTCHLRRGGLWPTR